MHSFHVAHVAELHNIATKGMNARGCVKERRHGLSAGFSDRQEDTFNLQSTHAEYVWSL